MYKEQILTVSVSLLWILGFNFVQKNSKISLRNITQEIVVVFRISADIHAAVYMIFLFVRVDISVPE